MRYTLFFVGTMRFLQELRWGVPIDGKDTVTSDSGVLLASAFPMPLPQGDPVMGRVHGDPVFTMGNGDAVYSRSAFDYLAVCLEQEVAALTQSAQRRSTFAHRLRAVAALYRYIEISPPQRAMKVRQWNTVHRIALESRLWSREQERVLDHIRIGTTIEDVADLDGNRMLFISGEPGSGKSEVLVHAAAAAATAGCNVLVLCPTGVLVHGYRARLPEDDRITVETIHSAFCIHRAQDAVVKYSPPTRLRRYELIILTKRLKWTMQSLNAFFSSLKSCYRSRFYA